ncbi:proliferating cell nuclear antigen (pcna) [Acidianus sulfidivorans JP7]|uniref:proliferating cell nuclear antigen (pcna) n=1 Tax=Acidianus sulfidivorans TaxID=312539 RepID=UPI0014436E71|nr:proliferating cell nuclear antigen (pcna) [Acidianus sulfidivorans]QIJ32888.1 proliferating cell nuclear antigen (pcna) [Acidianus sulfidivorans JP7]
MRVSYEDVRDLKAIVTALVKLVDEASIKFTPSGIELVAIDRAHISLIKLSIPKEAFNEYDVQEEFSFGFNTQYFLKILSTSKRKETITFESNDPSLVSIELGGGSDSINRIYSIRNLEVSPPEIPELNLQFDVSATVNSSGFKKAIDEISAVSDVIIIRADENGILLKGKSESNVEVELDKNMGGLQDIELNKPTESSYSSDYLSDILVLTKLSGFTKLAFSEQKPLQIQFNMESGGNVTYLLAPQMG